MSHFSAFLMHGPGLIRVCKVNRNEISIVRKISFEWIPFTPHSFGARHSLHVTQNRDKWRNIVVTIRLTGDGEDLRVSESPSLKRSRRCLNTIVY